MGINTFDPFNREPNPDDSVLDEPQVLTLVRQHLPNAAAVTRIDESGGEARTYFIDDDYLVKTQRPHKVRLSTSLEKESFHLRKIAENAPEASVPRVLGYGRDGSIEYIVMTRMAGVATRYLDFDGEARRSALFEVGRTLRRVHGVDLDAFRGSDLFPGDTNAVDVRERIGSGLLQAAETVAAQQEVDLGFAPSALVARIMDLVKPDELVPLHTNPGPEHVFVDPSTLKFEGIIDFADAYISHPAFDMRRWSAPADRAAVLEGYCSEEKVSDAFLSTWRAVMVSGLLRSATQRPERRQQAIEDLRTFSSDL